MRFHSSRLTDVLLRGSFDSRWVCDVFYDGQRRMANVDVTDVKLTEDGNSKVQQSGSLTIVYQGQRGDSIAPKSVEDLLSPFGTTLMLYCVISEGALFEERVAMGSYVVSDTPTIESSSWSLSGRSLSKGDRIGISFKDPFYKVSRNRFDTPGVTPSLASCYAEIQRLTRLTVTRNPAVADAAIPRALVYEEDRLDAVYELAQTRDATPYMMGDGSMSLRPNAWGSPVDTITAANAGDEPAVLTAEGRTAWAEQRRNLAARPLGQDAADSTGYGGANAASVVFDAPTHGVRVTAPASGTVDSGVGFAGALSYTAGVATYTVSLDVTGEVADGWKISVQGGWVNARADSAYTPVGVGETKRLSFTFTTNANALGTIYLLRQTAALASRAVVRRVQFEPGAVATPYLDGSLYPGGGLKRSRWLGAVGASISVEETRQIIPAVYAPRKPYHGTLIGVKRGMSADGVYNRVVVRAQGQQSGVLAAIELTDGPLRAANPNGDDSPFGRVPYFLSSQFITTPQQAQAEAVKWLPRLSRPQATVLDIEEILNPIREVGDVVTVKRAGESFPARVVKVQRSSAKTQTTSVLVVPQ